jgi:hypothetical protein
MLSDRRVEETQDPCYKCKRTWNKSSTYFGQKDVRKERVSLWVCGFT